MIHLKCSFCGKQAKYKNNKKRALENFLSTNSSNILCADCVKNTSIENAFVFPHWPWFAILDKKSQQQANEMLVIRNKKERIRKEKQQIIETQYKQEREENVQQTLSEMHKAFGSMTADEYFDIIYEKADKLASVEVGYNEETNSIEEIDASPEMAVLSFYKGKYIIWRAEEIVHGEGAGFTNDDPHVFSDEKTAREYLKKQENTMNCK